MNCLTACDLSQLDNIERHICDDVSVSLLAELERELLRLRSDLSTSEWKAFCGDFPGRPVFDVLRVGGLALRRLEDSRFALPADVLDTLTTDSFQARPFLTRSVAHIISAWEYSLPVSRSVRARRWYFSREIAEVVRTGVKPRILILGAGRMREADDLIRACHLQHVEFVALEADAKVSQTLRHNYSRFQIRIEDGGWERLRQVAAEWGKFDLIYSTAWLDSMEDAQAARWIETGVEMLRSGGRILAANFCPGSRDAGWIEACWNWHPCYRSKEDLAHLVMEIPSREARSLVRGHAVVPDESGASSFLEIHSI